MRGSVRRLWLAASVEHAVLHEAASADPNETGGILLGYQTSAGRVTVVTDVRSAGPDARHSRFSFVPDYDHDEREAEEVARQSCGVVSYVGDWHTHPGATSATLSAKDRFTLKTIAKQSGGSLHEPVMLVVAGDWKRMLAAWQLIANVLHSRIVSIEIVRFDG
jgi:integrative and conjugative element protein (TIGR02256 family)